MSQKPSPVASLSQKQLARWAFDQACAQLNADAAAGRVAADVALLRFNALSAAYQRRKQDLELGSFLRSRGYKMVLGNAPRKLTRPVLASKARIGDENIERDAA